MIGCTLILLVVISCTGDWFQVTESNCPGELTVASHNCVFSVPTGSLWYGFGMLPALLLVAAALLFATRRVPRLAVALPVRESIVWMMFAGMEIILFCLYWLIPSGVYVTGVVVVPVGGVGASVAGWTLYTEWPGWPFFTAVGLAIVLALGGLARCARGDRSTRVRMRGREASVPSARSQDPVPSRAVVGYVIIGVSLALLVAFSLEQSWLNVGPQCSGGLFCALGGVDAHTSLWYGVGFVPAALLVAAIVFFVLQRVPQPHVVGPVGESVVWMVFAAVEILLFITFWAMVRGSFIFASMTGAAASPGMSLEVSVVLAIVIGIGGGAAQMERRR